VDFFLFVLFGVGLFCRGQTHLGNAALGGAGDHAIVAAQRKEVAYLGQTSMSGDEKAVRQLITILLDNAIKYANDGGKIEITLKKQKNMIYLSAFNTVESISKENIMHLFDRFYRVDQSRNSQTGGYGLGLSIASAIVNAHKGKITASTEDEKSLLITAAFPV